MRISKDSFRKKSGKQKCAKCGDVIENPKSQYQRFCENCQNGKKELKGGSENNMALKSEQKKYNESTKKSGVEEIAAKKKKEKVVVAKSPEKDVKALRKELASKIVSYMKNDLKIAADELLAINHQVWRQLKADK